MIRYARWAAVSTTDQAKLEKASIEVQLAKGLEVGNMYGWVETHEPFVVPGESRTKYISLYHAEKEIPQLHDMLEAASRGEFDVLYVYDLNRFRNLMLQIFEVFCDFNVQIFNGNDPKEPVDPKDYTPEVQNAVRLNIKLHDILSNEETNKLQKHNREKMPLRVTKKGLHAGNGTPPYGYRKPVGFEKDPEAVLEPDPVTSPVILEIKDLFFAGKSINQIKDHLNEKGVPPPSGRQWWHGAITYILENSFYSGTVFYGASRRQRDRRSGTMKKIRGLKPQVAEGRHKPLWDAATRHRIHAELSRRGKAHAGHRTRRLSRLLYCHCGERMWVRYERFYQNKGEVVWACRTHKGGHAFIKDADAMKLFIPALVEALKDPGKLQVSQPEDNRAQLTARIRELEAKQKRWADGFENGDIDSHEYASRSRVIREQIAEAQAEIDGLIENSLAILQKMEQLKEFAESIDTAPYYIAEGGDPQEVNAKLRSMVSRAVVEKGKIRIEAFQLAHSGSKNE